MARGLGYRLEEFLESRNPTDVGEAEMVETAVMARQVEYNGRMREISADVKEITEIREAIEESEEVATELEGDVIPSIEEAIEDGGMEEREAQHVEARLESLCERAGINYYKSTGLIFRRESFSSSGSRLSQTRRRLESSKGFLSRIWDAIVKAWNYVSSKVSELVGKATGYFKDAIALSKDIKDMIESFKKDVADNKKEINTSTKHDAKWFDAGGEVTTQTIRKWGDYLAQSYTIIDDSLKDFKQNVAQGILEFARMDGNQNTQNNLSQVSGNFGKLFKGLVEKAGELAKNRDGTLKGSEYKVIQGANVEEIDKLIADTNLLSGTSKGIASEFLPIPEGKVIALKITRHTSETNLGSDFDSATGKTGSAVKKRLNSINFTAELASNKQGIAKYKCASIADLDAMWEAQNQVVNAWVNSDKLKTTIEEVGKQLTQGLEEFKKNTDAINSERNKAHNDPNSTSNDKLKNSDYTLTYITHSEVIKAYTSFYTGCLPEYLKASSSMTGAVRDLVSKIISNAKDKKN